MIVIPMAGLSSRFTRAGYDKPKYMLPLQGESVFAHSVRSFSTLFDTMPFLFIARSANDTEKFIEDEVKKLGIKKWTLIILDQNTAGQAETVEVGIQKAHIDSQVPLTIFNIDTFRKDFSFPAEPWFLQSDGYLEVFKGGGDNWSYVSALDGVQEPRVKETAEKKAISDLCCDGLYHFAKTEFFLESLAKERLSPSSKELFVAPLYNHLINEAKNIHYNIVPRSVITFCGVPKEYEQLVNHAVN